MVDKEIESLFYSDVASKKSIARSAQSASRMTSALRKYGLNRNYKIKKGKKEDTVSINMYKYIPWKKFKSLPKDLQEQYYQTIIDKYQIWADGIAKLWVGETSRETIRQHLITLNIIRTLPIGVKAKRENTKQFLIDYGKPENMISNRKKPKKELIETVKDFVDTVAEKEEQKSVNIKPIITKTPETKNSSSISKAILVRHSEVEFKLSKETELKDMIVEVCAFLEMCLSKDSSVKIIIDNN